MMDHDRAEWSPIEAYAQLRALRDNPASQRVGTAADAYNVVLLMLQHTSCPHSECPRSVLEEHNHQQEGKGKYG